MPLPFAVVYTNGDPATLNGGQPQRLAFESGEAITINLSSADSVPTALTGVPLQITIYKSIGFGRLGVIPDARFSGKDVGGTGKAVCTTLSGDTSSFGGRACYAQLQRLDTNAIIANLTLAIGGESPEEEPVSGPALPNTIWAGPSSGTIAGAGGYRYAAPADMPGDLAAIAADISGTATGFLQRHADGSYTLGSSSGGGTVNTITPADGTITINSTDPANPTIKVASGQFVPQAGLTARLPLNGNTLRITSGDAIVDALVGAGPGTATLIGTNSFGPYLQSAQGQLAGFDVSGNLVLPMQINATTLNVGTVVMTGSTVDFGGAELDSVSSGSIGNFFCTTVNGNTITTGTGTLTLSTFTVTAAGNATISNTNSGDQNIFASVVVSGQTTVTTASTSQALTLAAGSNITITTNNSTKTITIAASASSGMTNPMTTLGDIIYEDVTPTPVRLAGNTTAVKQYLSQTGTGSASAPPAWATIAAADLSDGNSGTGAIVHVTSPTLVTPVLGAATGTSVSVSGNVTGASFVGSIAAGSLSGTTLPAAIVGSSLTTVGTLQSPTLVTPTLGAASATTINKVTITAPATAATLTLANNSTLATSGAFSTTFTVTALTAVTLPTTGTLATIGNVETLTNKTLTGPTMTAPILGAATATSVSASGNITAGTFTGPATGLTGTAASLLAGTSSAVVGETTVGGNLITLTNPSAISFIRVNADNSITARTPAQVLSDIAAMGTAGGTFSGGITLPTSANATAGGFVINNGTLTTVIQNAGTNCTFNQPLSIGGIIQATNFNGIASFGIQNSSAVPTGAILGTAIAQTAGTITGWSITVDAGTATVEFWKIASGTASPTVANTINTSGVAISTGTVIESTTVTDFTSTTITKGDIMICNVKTISGVKVLSVQLVYSKA